MQASDSESASGVPRVAIRCIALFGLFVWGQCGRDLISWDSRNDLAITYNRDWPP